MNRLFDRLFPPQGGVWLAAVIEAKDPYNVHLDGYDFEVEWDKTVDVAWVPQPDTHTVSEVTWYAPRELRLPASFLEFKPGF